MMEDRQRTVLFFPLNSPGHINSSLGIADILKREHNCRTVFLLLGKMMGTSVEDHGHELIILKEKNVHQDFEIEDGEDVSVPVDKEAKERVGDTMKSFEGVFKWPQLIQRVSHILKLDPADAFIACAELLEKTMVKELTENHGNYARAIEDIKPDLLIIDAYYVPPCVLKLNVPWVRLYSANPLMLVKSKLADGVKPAPMVGFRLHDKQTRERMRCEQPQKWQSIVEEWRTTAMGILKAMSNAGDKLNNFLIEHNCEPLPPGKQAPDSPYLNIYMYPKALDYDQDDDLFEYPTTWLRCDSLVRQQPQGRSAEAHELQDWKQKLAIAARGKEAIVYFSLGSLASGNQYLMQRFVDFLKHDQRRLYVISKGANGDRYELDKGNMIGDKYIPQTYFLQQADLAIIHGGNNSLTECMYYGKPMIVLPVFADQLDNAQRVEDLGYGRRLDVFKCTKEQLLGAINDTLDDKQLKDKMHSIGENMKNCDDLPKTCKLLMKLAKGDNLTHENINECCKQ